MIPAGANKAMRGPTENGRCPVCRRTGACRSVSLGFWCQQDGLIEDTSRRIVPERDPVSVAVHADPTVLAASAVAEDRQRVVDAANAAWVDTLRTLATYKLKNGVLVNEHGLFRELRRGGRKLSELTEAAAAARVALDDAVEFATRARTAYRKVVGEAWAREINKERARQATTSAG